MKKTDTGELSGTLEGVIMLQGNLGREVGVRVAGQDFLKRFWKEKENETFLARIREKSKNIFGMILSTDEFNYKKEFLEEHKQHIGEIVKIEFKEVRVNWIHYAIDWIHGPRYPRRYLEILSLSYQGNK